MSLKTELFAALGPLVGGRVSPDTFGQDQLWPAIRYTTISAVPDTTVCGFGGDNETDFRIQLDGVAKTGVLRDQLRLDILAALRQMPTPTTVDGWSEEYDVDTKAYRVQMDIFVHPSSSDSP